MSPVPEPASAALRRLHEEATRRPITTSDVPTVLASIDRFHRARATIDNALPALADLVAYTEKVATQPCHWMPMHEPGDVIRDCNPCEARRALAALRERLGAKP